MASGKPLVFNSNDSLVLCPMAGLFKPSLRCRSEAARVDMACRPVSISPAVQSCSLIVSESELPCSTDWTWAKLNCAHDLKKGVFS